MRILILHQQVDDRSGADELDVVEQAKAVRAALVGLGHQPRVLACDLDLARIRRELEADAPDMVFNLVESLAGTDRLIPLVPSLLDALGVPYTGSPTHAITLSTNKMVAKAWLARHGLPVPPTVAAWPRDVGPETPTPTGPSGRVVVKSVWEHGSRGLDDGCVLPIDDRLAATVQRLAPALGGAAFAELYVHGREINVSLLEQPSSAPEASTHAVEILPPAEIEFRDVADGSPRIVGSEAKWDPDSGPWHATPRRFGFPAADAPLIEQIAELSRRAWDALGLRGYARVDFRIDEHGHPYLLEVNVNPCLSPDAGFAAALAEAGIPFAAAVERILASAGVAVDSSERRASGRAELA